MKRFFCAIALAVGLLVSCSDYEYYTPAFYGDTIDYTISALGGDYPVQYTYVPYTKAITKEFDFVYRVIIDGEASESLEPKNVERSFDTDGNRVYTFYVTIPANTTGHLRPILIEASTYVVTYDDDYESYWSDWFPVISTVQLY